MEVFECFPAVFTGLRYRNSSSFATVPGFSCQPADVGVLHNVINITIRRKPAPQPGTQHISVGLKMLCELLRITHFIQTLSWLETAQLLSKRGQKKKNRVRKQQLSPHQFPTALHHNPVAPRQVPDHSLPIFLLRNVPHLQKLLKDTTEGLRRRCCTQGFNSRFLVGVVASSAITHK